MLKNKGVLIITVVFRDKGRIRIKLQICANSLQATSRFEMNKTKKK